MDNLTHSIIGAAFARSLPKRMQRPEIYWASVLGNNIPDADVLIRLVPGTDALDYLVHHRGWSHTFLLAPFFGLLAAYVARKIAGLKETGLSVIGIGILGCFMHVGADFMNSYGVHPFSPFSNTWYFGDSIYIVEPLLWFTLVPYLAQETLRRSSRVGWWVLTIPMIGLIWWFPGFTPGRSAFLTGFLAISAAVAIGLKSSKGRTAVVTALLILTYGGFGFAGYRSRQIARGYWQSATEATETLIDVSSNPQPGNPACWIIWLAAKTGTEYRTRSAVVSLWPERFSTEECGGLGGKAHTADLVPSNFPPGHGIVWERESRIAVAEFESLRERSATFRYFLHFARFPFIQKVPGGGTIVGDLRFDREVGRGFAEFEIPADEKGVPVDGPWTPPFH